MELIAQLFSVFIILLTVPVLFSQLIRSAIHDRNYIFSSVDVLAMLCVVCLYVNGLPITPITG